MNRFSAVPCAYTLQQRVASSSTTIPVTATEYGSPSFAAHEDGAFWDWYVARYSRTCDTSHVCPWADPSMNGAQCWSVDATPYLCILTRLVPFLVVPLSMAANIAATVQIAHTPGVAQAHNAAHIADGLKVVRAKCRHCAPLGTSRAASPHYVVHALTCKYAPA